MFALADSSEVRIDKAAGGILGLGTPGTAPSKQQVERYSAAVTVPGAAPVIMPLVHEARHLVTPAVHCKVSTSTFLPLSIITHPQSE